MVENTRQGSKGGDELPQGDPGADCGLSGPLPVAPMTGAAPPHRAHVGLVAQGKGKPNSSVTRGTRWARRSIPRAWVVVRG